MLYASSGARALELQSVEPVDCDLKSNRVLTKTKKLAKNFRKSFKLKDLRSPQSQSRTKKELKPKKITEEAKFEKDQTL